jgi:dTDP-4-amino-4,6-dideoxygalactose transaminase
MKYSLNLPLITNVENKFSLDVLKSGWISVGGKYNKLFEKKFGQIISKKNNLLVQSGTAALHLALKAININKNHSVITPNFSCSANINCISQCGAKAIVVESENDTLGLDFDLVKKAIIKFKPKALQLVHVYGFPARDTEKIVQFCKKKKVIIIEDASESLGATINGKMVGSFGDISIFSLRSEKMIGVGEGGIISTNSKSYFNSIELIASRNMPFRKKKDPYWKKYISNGEGYNYTMPHILAAIGLAQLKKLNYIVKKKREIGRIYREEMKQFSFAQNILKGFKPVFWLNHIYLSKLSDKKVRALGSHLMKNNIEVRSGFWPLINTKGVRKVLVSNKNRFSNNLFKKLLILPSNVKLKRKDIRFIKNKITYFINK